MAFCHVQGATDADHMLPHTPACEGEIPLPRNPSDLPTDRICGYGKHSARADTAATNRFSAHPQEQRKELEWRAVNAAGGE